MNVSPRLRRFGSASTRWSATRRSGLSVLGICCVLLLLDTHRATSAAPATPAAAAAGEDHQLKLKAAVFDPATGLPAHLVETGPPAVGLAAPAGRGELYIVQFQGTPGAAEQARLSGLGMTVLDYLPEQALIVRLSAGAKAGSLPSIEGVRAVVPFVPKLRLSPDLRDLASAKPPAPGRQGMRINAWLAIDGDPEALAKAAQKSFPGVSAPYIRRKPAPSVQFSGPPARLKALAEALARHPDVLFVDRLRPSRLINDQSVWIGQSNDRVDGPDEAAAPDPKPYTHSGTVFNHDNHGITGTGQVIGVADTRLEDQLCFFTDPAHPLVRQTVTPPGLLTLDPNHRKILAYNNLSTLAVPPYPTWRHGTHTAGSAVGDSLANLSTPLSAGHDAGDGMAPNAKLVYLDMYAGIEDNCVDAISPSPLANILEQEYQAGARLSTHSYESDEDVAVDTEAWQRPDLLVFFAIGNQPRPMFAANGAKNVVSVGATETYDLTNNLDPENMASFSVLGPANRIKPDVTAPGVAIASAAVPFNFYLPPQYPSPPAACVQGDPNVCFNDFDNNPDTFEGCYVSLPAQTCSMVKLQGTSMASPTAAGLGALARQYFTDGFYPSGQANPGDAWNPSAALLKSVLINGAQDMTGHYLDGNGMPQPLADAPSNRQGWGRIMLDDALYFASDSRKLFLADIPSLPGSGVGTGERLLYKVTVTSTASPLKFTLVWTDPPASPPAGQSVRNDLDLVVTAPNGTVYKGNQWTADNINVPGDMESAPNPAGRDTSNNVEGVLIHTPQIGDYQFEVQGHNVPGYLSLFTQGFAVVATGEFTGGFAFPQEPRIDSVSPSSGVNSNPTLITITGDRFQATPQVYLGTAAEPQKYALSAVTFISSAQLQATVPVNMLSGTYNILVINPDTMSDTLANVFTVGAPVQNATMYIAGQNPDTNAADQLTVVDLVQGTLLPPVALTKDDDPADVAVNRTAGKGVIAMYGGGAQTGKVAIMSISNPTKVTNTLNVPSGRRALAVAIHPSGNPAYLLSVLVNPGTTNQLHRLDLSTGTFTGTPLTLGVGGYDIEVSPDGQRVYATNSNDNTLSVIRTSDFVEIARVPVGDFPVGIGVSPDSTKVYVANLNSNTISIVDATLLATVGTIDVSSPLSPYAWPIHVVVSPDGSKLYVAYGNTWITAVTVDLATQQITQTLTLGDQLKKIAYIPSLDKLFVLAFIPDLKRLNPANLQVEWTQNHGLWGNGMDWVEPAPPTITSVVPNAACSTVGGTTVTITGSAFQGEVLDGTTIVQQRTRVFFGNVEATSVTLVDSMHLSVVAPLQAPGFVNVEVRNPNGLSATLTNGVHYHSCNPLAVTPVSYSFATSSVGETSASQSFTVTNYGNHDPVHVGTVSIAGANPYDFIKTADGCSGQTLVTNGTCVVQVAFRPTTIGARSGTLSILSDDPDNPVLSASLSGSAPTALYNLVELPNSDAGPNQGSPTPSGAHYLNVDDDPHDGDTTFLTFSGSTQKEVYTIADALHDTDIIASVKVRWTAKKGAGSTWTGKAGVVVGSTEYYGPTVTLPVSYTTREEVFATNPATGQPWTVAAVRSAKLVYQQVTIQTQLPRAALTQLVLVVAVRRVPYAASLLERPNADVGPNQGSPTPSGAHYLNVDEDPHDGDATILSFTSGGYKEVYTYADQLLNTDIVADVKVRWTAKKGSGTPWTAKAGVVVGSTEYYGPTATLTTNYLTREETFVVNPATGQPWTVQDVRSGKLIYQQVTIVTQLPRAALTQLVLVVSVLRMPVLATLTKLPNSDASPNQGAPTPAGAHYLNVDDDPNDGDTTMLSFAGAGYKEVFTTADQLLDTDHVQNVKVRWVAKKGQGNNWNAHAGLVVGSTEFYGPTVNLTTGYTVREETFGTNPATTQFWTVQEVRAAKLIYQQVTITAQQPKAQLTEMVLIVQVERAP